MESYRGRLPTLSPTRSGTWLANDCRVLFVTDQPQRVREICAELNLPVTPREEKVGAGRACMCTEGRLRAGFKIADLRLYLLTDAELFGSARPVVTRRRVAGGVAISSVLDLRENDFVVHIHHGIGIYRGLVKRKVEGETCATTCSSSTRAATGCSFPPTRSTACSATSARTARRRRSTKSAATSGSARRAKCASRRARWRAN